MEILILANKVPYPPKDGGAIATLNMALGLHKAGAKITLMAMSTPKHSSTKHDFPQSILEKIEVETIFVNTNLSMTKAFLNLFFSNKPYNASRFDDVSFHKRLELLLTQKTFDTIQLEGPFFNLYIRTIRKHYKGPIALRAHNVEWELWERNAQIQKNIFKKLYFKIIARRLRRLEKEILSNINLLVPISIRDERKLQEMGYSGSTFICPAGYDLDKEFVLDTSFESPSIFHLGGLDWAPNQDGLLWFLDNCWPIILKSVPKVLFYIAGRNAADSFVAKLINYQNVVFCGEVDDSKQFIVSKGVMVVPLLSGSGMRVKIVEGMTYAKAIVSTTIGAEGIEVEHGKHIAIAENSHQFANEVINLLESKNKVLEMGRNARIFALQHFDLTVISQNLLHFYQREKYSH